MFNKLKKLPTTFASWYQKKKEEEKQTEPFQQFNPDNKSPFLLNTEKQMSVFNPQTKQIETPIKQVETFTLNESGEKKSLGSKFTSMLSKVDEHVQDVAGRTSVTMADQLGFQNAIDYLKSKSTRFESMKDIKGRMFTQDKEKGMSVYDPREGMPQIENKTLNTIARIGAEMSFYIGASIVFHFGLIRAFPFVTKIAPQVTSVVSRVAARGLSHQMKLDYVSSIEDRTKHFFYNLPRDATLSVGLLPSVDFGASIPTMFTGSFISNKLLGMDNQAAVVNAGVETAIGSLLKFAIRPPSMQALQKRIITSELGLKPNATVEEIKKAMQEQVTSKIFYKDNLASPMIPKPKIFATGNRIFTFDSTTGEMRINKEVAGLLSAKDMDMLDV
jgi:hypothetical protein